MYCAVSHQLFDIMHQAEHLPLSLHLVFSTQREATQSLVCANITEDWLDHRHAMTVNCLAFHAIDPSFHPVRCCFTIRPSKRDLSSVAIPYVSG